MSTQLIITILAAIGGSTGIVSLVMLLPQIRKLQADTSKVERDSDLAEIEGAARLSQGALDQMGAAFSRAERAEAHVDRLEQQVQQFRVRLEEVEHDLYEYRRVAQDHVAWDYERIRDMVQRCGMKEEDVPVPPPLLPPRKRDKR